KIPDRKNLFRFHFQENETPPLASRFLSALCSNLARTSAEKFSRLRFARLQFWARAVDGLGARRNFRERFRWVAAVGPRTDHHQGLHGIRASSRTGFGLRMNR